MVWIVVVVLLVVPLVLLAVSLLRAYRAGKRLAAEVGRASEAVAVTSELSVGRPATPPPAATEEGLRTREAALAEREAELERRLRRAPS